MLKKLWKFIIIHQNKFNKDIYGVTFTDTEFWWKKARKDMEDTKEDQDE